MKQINEQPKINNAEEAAVWALILLYGKALGKLERTEKLVQAEIYLRLANTDISINDHFLEQAEADRALITNTKAEEISWRQLKEKDLESYKHEKSHDKIWGKYGVRTKLYHVPSTKKGYFVIDQNFGEVAVKKGYGKAKIITIYKEMLSASFIKKKEKRFEDLLDIVFFEILERNIRDIHFNEFERVLKKYCWDP